MGQTRYATLRAERPAHRFSLHIWRDLPEARKRRGARHAALRHAGDEPASGRDRKTDRAWGACCLAPRSSGLASLQRTEHPANITIVPLPAKCPELNPQENVWQFMRDNWISNRVFESYNDILDHCCYAWNTLIDRPWRIMSLGMPQWAHGF